MKNKVSLLVVDDDDVDRERIRRMLKASDLNVKLHEVSTAGDTYIAVGENNFDCIIVDYRLGNDDGLDVLTSIRKHLHKQCAVIMVTGLGDEEIAARALRLGANDYLVKSQLEPAKLIHAIGEAIHKAELNQKVHELAHFDPLTGLVSRHLLIDRVQQVIARNKRSSKISALAFIDLDNFKPVNDQYGHDFGDEVLIEVASRLTKAVRGTDTVSRLGGDEFVVLSCEMDSTESCEDLFQRIILVLGVPIRLSNGCSVRVSASVGVALVDSSELDADALLRKADQAMYKAKNSGKNRFQFFDPKEELKQKHRRLLLQRSETALNNHEFELYFQPKVDFLQKRLVGMEALIRWNHPKKGLILPGEFHESLSHSQVGIRIGEWVIEEAIESYRIFKDHGIDTKISINISPMHIHSLEFFDRFQLIFNKFKDLTDLNFLEIEVLESVSISDIKYTSQVLGRCKEYGISIAIDDFGTGYASLRYLKYLPIDTIKIDRTFVKTIDISPVDSAIVRGISSISESLNFYVIAEGVETEKQAKELMDIGCNHMQGYLIAKPMPLRDLIHWYQTKKYSL